MRLLSLLILVVVVAVVVAFVVQNEDEVTVHFFDYGLPTTLAKLVGVTYLLGMVSGWTVVGILRRSVERMTEPAQRDRYPAR